MSNDMNTKNIIIITTTVTSAQIQSSDYSVTILETRDTRFRETQANPLG